jgi:hypothetical protein
MKKIELKHDWMVISKMQSLLTLSQRDFAEEGDIAEANQLIAHVRQLLDNSTLSISDVYRSTAKEDLELMEMLLLTI